MHLGPDAPGYVFGSLTGYRYLPYAATYSPDAPYGSGDGRFDDGLRFTLYVADAPEAATASPRRPRRR